MSRIIRYEYGTLPPRYLRDAAQAACDASAAKHAALGAREEAAVELLAQSLDVSSALFAYRGEAWAGMAGLVTRNARFLRLRLGPALRLLGPGRGLVYWLVGRAEARLPEGELKVGALGVHREMRGQGVGRGLLRQAEALAGQWGMHTLSLNVVDTNAVARRLYEHEGFEVVGCIRFGVLTRGAGFSCTYHMRKEVAPRGPH